MPLNAQGFWLPNLFPRQFEVFNSPARVLLLSGAALGGKSVASMNKIVRHMWDTDRASVAFFSKIIKTAYESGSWELLTKTVMKEWVEAGIGLYFTTKDQSGKPGARVSGTSRTPTFSIRNRYGTESTCRLFSLEHDQEIEAKVKDHFFSMIYFAELDKFKDRKILSLTRNRLRMQHLRYDQQMWLADTNPAEDGEKSWIYQFFFAERNMSYPDYCENCRQKEQQPMDDKSFANYQKEVQVIEFPPEENPFLDPKQLEELKESFRYDPDLYARYVQGKWVFGFGDQSRHLRQFFKPHHIIGNTDSAREEEWEVALPSATCLDIATGWDIGDCVNHAEVDVEPVYQGAKMHYVVLDECVSIGDAMSTAEFTRAAVVKIEALENTAAAQRKIPGFKFPLQQNYSDNSILRFSAHADEYPYVIVHASSLGRIVLDAMEQSEKAVRIRVQLIKFLLRENRLHVSAQCKYVRRMLNELRKGKTNSEFVVNDENKHVFDALTFVLIKLCSEELLNLPQIDTNVGRRSSFTVAA